jgi:hypothetical protein
MALNCIYHPTLPMQVVEDDEKEKFMATGFWFDHPSKAKSMREDYERQIRRDERKRGRPSKSTTKDV